MHTLGGLLRRVDELLEGTDSEIGWGGLTQYYRERGLLERLMTNSNSGRGLLGQEMTVDYDPEPCDHFLDRKCAMEWSNMLFRYLEMHEFFDDIWDVRHRYPGHDGSRLAVTWRDMSGFLPDLRQLNCSITNFRHRIPSDLQEYMERNPRMARMPGAGACCNLVTFLRNIHDYMEHFSDAAERQNIVDDLLGLRIKEGNPQIPDMMELLFEFFRTRLGALRELRAELVNTRHTLGMTMLDFAMGTHDRLGERSWVRLLGADHLSTIRDLWPVIDE